MEIPSSTWEFWIQLPRSIEEFRLMAQLPKEAVSVQEVPGANTKNIKNKVIRHDNSICYAIWLALEADSKNACQAEQRRS
jgi:hypothetical protein